MMKAPLSIFLFLLFSYNDWAQTPHIQFNLIVGKDGISLGKINGITQDPGGYMWFADQTQRCITRYDGYSMQSFRNDPLNDNSLGGTYPECIISDPSGIIWIGFNGMGLDRFDPETGRFTHFRHQANDPASLSSDTVNALLMDHLGNLWVGSYGGVDLLDNKTGKFKHYHYRADDPTTISNDRIRALYEDRHGTIWIGAGSAFENDNPNEGGLNRFNRETETFTRYLNDPKNPHTLINNKVRAIFEDSRGTFWVGTAGDGLHTMDRATGLFTRHTYNSAHPEKLSRPPVNDVDDHITFLTEDATGAIWIGTYKAGLSRYDPVTKALVRFNSNTWKTGGFVDNSGWTAYNSRDKVLWVSAEPQNLYRINPFHITIPHIASAGSVNSFFQEPDQAVWIGTNVGLMYNDRNTKNIKWFIHDPLNRASISNNNISSISKDKKGNLWIGTYEAGLNKFDAEKKIFTHFRHNPKNSNSLLSDTIYKTYVDAEGLLWISTISGLDQINLTTGTFTHYQHDSKDINSLSNNSVREIFQDRQKRLWVGEYFGGGLNVMDPKTHTFKHYLSGLDIKSIYQDSDNTIWVGTTGLYRFDIPSATFEIFTDPENKTGFNNVTSIIEDNEKNLWVSTSEGIIRINQKRNKLDIFDKTHGVHNSLNARAVYKGLNNELFFGASSGYYNFKPQELAQNNQPPEILLSDFRLGDKLVKQGQNSPLRQPLIKTKEILLGYQENIFSFDFAAIDYSDPEKNRHLFMLENYDNTWRPGNERRAYYFNVPPGHYIFRVKAANSNGIWVERSVKITITPPWWRTWWAYCFYGLCFMTGLLVVDRIQRRRLIRREREKAKERELQQAHEIEKAYRELKATQAQLIQTEKMASLGQLTAGIAHEIQNPLNFVNNFSEVNKELIAEMKEEIDRGNMDGIKSITNDLEENEQKINHHGKRADAIVKGMLQHSRATSGKKEPTDINALADEYLRLSYHGLRAKDKDFNATIETSFDAGIGKINIVPQDLGRVLLNLCNNAFYAVNEKKKTKDLEGFQNLQGLNGYEPTVCVTTKKIDGKVEITIKDNGNGIPQKIIDKIFHPFFTTKPPGHGTGLGLSLSYDIVKAHGGELRVETKEGEGSEFIIRIPA